MKGRSCAWKRTGSGDKVPGSRHISARETRPKYLPGARTAMGRPTQVVGWASQWQMCADPSTWVIRPSTSARLTRVWGETPEYSCEITQLVLWANPST